MANIQWFPGHMHKTAKEIRENLSQVDVFFELLDSRIPYSSGNPLLSEIRGAKPCIKVMTRSDLADPARTSIWLEQFASEGDTYSMAVSQLERDKVRSLVKRCRALFPQRETPVTAIVVGIPNVGKSTLINILADRVIAKTGNEPAITKMQQRVQIGQGVVLLDTPGVLWPNIDNPYSGLRLAATGAIRETAMSHEDVAWYLAQFLLADYAEQLASRYEFEAEETDPAPLLKHIGRQRGCLKAGGGVDMARVSRLLLNDFRNGSIGRITLETPDMMRKEQTEVEHTREEKAAKKAARKQKWKNRNRES
ncbi:MAG: ribosome biogenesis GTPase YlqF [bacterium]